MTQPLTFSELVDRSYKAMQPLLKTYILGALLLIIVSLIFRGIGGGLIALADHPAVQENLVLVLTAVIIGFLCTIVSVIVQMAQNIYALVIAVDRTKNVKAGIRKTFQYLWRLLLGGIWIMLRSFGWISVFGLPFFILGANGNNGMILIGGIIVLVGIVCALYFLPMLAYTNIIQLKDGTGVRESAELSLKRTQGYWGKIVGNNLLVGLCIGLTTVAIVAVVALLGFMLLSMLQSLNTTMMIVIGTPIGLIVGIAAMIYFFAITLFAQLFMVELYETIKAHPKITAS
ncbi:MAG: hypothetical protein KBA40_01435 [Candidatus Peribacteraceae bacterium]|nr:hypothetical protein [Candidatus Peribacteraceae bacterium]MBP9850494.1 hypothetical protein [Candidatus Peribacteraceae bacterium]